MVAALDHFDTWRPLQNTRRVLYRALRPRPGARILDAGCGTGLDVATLASLVKPGGAVHGMDLSERMVALARERYGNTPGVSFSAGSVSNIPFPDAHFDATFAMRTLQYLDDALPAVREMARVTKPGGRVAVVEGGMSRDGPALAGAGGPHPGRALGREVERLRRDALWAAAARRSATCARVAGHDGRARGGLVHARACRQAANGAAEAGVASR